MCEVLLQGSEIEVIGASMSQLDVETTQTSKQDARLPTMGFDTENFNPTGDRIVFNPSDGSHRIVFNSH